MPDPEKASAPAASDRPEPALASPSFIDSLSTTGTAGHRLVGQMNPAPRTTVGIGVWRVEKSDRYDPNRAQVMRDRTGRLSGIAAIGLNIGF